MRRSILGLALCASQIFISEQALADSDSSNSGVETVVVTGKRTAAQTATRLDVDPLDVPQAIASVPIELIQDEGFLRLGDAVRNVSSVVRKEAYFGVTDSFGIRGFDASTGLFDGFRKDYYSSVLDLSHVESVDVIKGPSSVTTGFLEPGGVVNVITKHATATPVFEGIASAGSYDRYRAQWDVGGAVTDDLNARFTGAIEHDGSFRDFIYSNKATAGGTVAWAPDSKTTLQVFAYYLTLNSRPDRGLPFLTNDGLGLHIPISRYFGQPDDQYHQRNWQSLALLDRQIAANWSLRFGAEYDDDHDFRDNVQAIALQPDGHTVSRDYTVVPGSEKTLNGFAEIHGTFDTFGLGHTLVAGADYTNQKQFYDFRETYPFTPLDIYDPVYTGIKTPPPSNSYFHGTTAATGFYVQDLIAIGDYVKFLGSLRSDNFTYHDKDIVADYTDRFQQSKVTPRVGIVVEPLSGLSLYSNYARSFNPNQFTLLASGQKPAPSEGTQYEIGVKYAALDGRLVADLAAYSITKTNVPTTDPNDPTGTFSILSGKERSRGIEFDVQATPVDGLEINASGSYDQAIVTADTVLPIGDELVNVPRYQASTFARYDIPQTPLAVGAGLFYVGKRQASLPNTFEIPAYTRLDAAVYYTVNEHAELALNVQNITDVRYYDSQDNSLYPGFPINAMISLRLKQ